MGAFASNVRWLFAHDLGEMRGEVDALATVESRRARDPATVTVTEVRETLAAHVETTRARLDAVAVDVERLRKSADVNSAKAHAHYAKAKTRETELWARLELLKIHIESLDRKTAAAPPPPSHRRHMSSVSGVFSRSARAARDDSEVVPFAS